MPTVTELIAQVRDIVDEPIGAQFSDTQLRRWLNEGNRDLSRSTRHLKTQQTIPTVAGTSSYTVNANALSIELAWYQDVPGARFLALEPRHMENMDAVRGYNWARTGTPSFFSTQGFSPNLQILIYPVPAVTADNIVVYVSRISADIDITGAGDASQVDTPSAWYDALADYAEMKCLRRDRDPRWSDAWKMYTDKRDGLINNPDYLAVNRELTVDPIAGALPTWLVEFD